MTVSSDARIVPAAAAAAAAAVRKDRARKGQGLAAYFTESVLTELGQGQEAVIPTCPYVRGYILKHPQWRDLSPPDVELSA